MVGVIAALLVPFVGAPGFGTTVAAAGNPSADLDQCANGGVGDAPEQCVTVSPSGNWVNGNLGASKAHYLEGDSVPYRLRFSDLDTSSAHTVTIEWDTTKGGKHALDYLTTYDRTEEDAIPTSGVAGLDFNVSTVSPIPADTTMQARSDWSGTQEAGDFTMWGGSISGVSAYTYSGDWTSQTSARLTVTFTATVTNPVLAWGGHIATRADWGIDNSAVAVSGSPYHMRLIDLDGAGGNQDRSLSEQAVIFPGSISVVKVASPDSATSFPFATPGLTPSTFSLVDDGSGPGADTQAFPALSTFGDYEITESVVTGWTLTDIACSDPDQGSSTDLEDRTATVDLDEGEAITCTFTNEGEPPDVLPDISVTKTADPTSVKESGGNVTFSFVVTNVGTEAVTITSLTDDVFGTLAGDDDCKVGTTLASGGSCSFSITRSLQGSSSTNHRDVFTAVVADDDEDQDTATDDAVVTFFAEGTYNPPVQTNPKIRVVKSPSESTVHDGDEVTYTYVVTNTGDVPLTAVDVDDDRCSPVTYLSGDTNGDRVLAVTETWRFECTTTLHESTLNTATVDGRDSAGRLVSDTDTARVVVIHPAVAIEKTPSISAGAPGDTVIYTYVVTNPGDDPLTDVAVTDDRCSPVVYQSGDADDDGALDPDETWTYECATVLPDGVGSLTNVGTVSAVDQLGAPLSDEDDATVAVTLPAVEPGQVEPDRELAFTGFTPWRMAWVAVAALALGAAFVLSTRRRRSDH